MPERLLHLSRHEKFIRATVAGWLTLTVILRWGWWWPGPWLSWAVPRGTGVVRVGPVLVSWITLEVPDGQT